jgi:hypothetical protein
MPVEAGLGEIDGLSLEQRVVTLGAARRLSQALARQTDHGIAMPADNVGGGVRGCGVVHKAASRRIGMGAPQ